MKITMQRFARNGSVSGFTLLEILMTVAIIGILAGIAYPNYMNYTLRANRAAAQTFLLNAAQRQTQYYLDNRVYAPDMTTLFGDTTSVPSGVITTYGTPVIATTAGPPPGFTITATPIGGQNKNNEPVLTIDQSGAKTPTGTAYGAW